MGLVLFSDIKAIVNHRLGGTENLQSHNVLLFSNT